MLLETAEVSQLLGKIGVTTDTVKSGRFKDTPSPLKPMGPAERAVVQELVDDGYDWFVGIFAERRHFDRNTAQSLADGRVYTGRQALTAKLVDELGGEVEARRWLESERGVPRSLPTRDLQPESEVEGLLAPFSQWARKMLFYERLRLDGLKSVWQPD